METVVVGFLVSIVAFSLGMILGVLVYPKHPYDQGRAMEYDSRELGYGTPFQVACRPIQFPEHALVNFFGNKKEPCLLHLPQPEPLTGFALGQVLVKREENGKPCLKVLEVTIDQQAGV